MYGHPSPFAMPLPHGAGMWPQGMLLPQGPLPPPPGMPMDAGMGGGGGQDSAVLKLKGLPFAATEHDVALFFEGFALVSASIHHGADGRPSGMVRRGAARVCTRGCVKP